MQRAGAPKQEDWVDQISTGLEHQAKTWRSHSAEADRPPTIFDKDRDVTKWDS